MVTLTLAASMVGCSAAMVAAGVDSDNVTGPATVAGVTSCVAVPVSTAAVLALPPPPPQPAIASAIAPARLKPSQGEVPFSEDSNCLDELEDFTAAPYYLVLVDSVV
jgi:hypothetical protein